MNTNFDEDTPFSIIDGYDDCVIGVIEQFGRPPIICYDRSLVIQKLMKDGMSDEEAEEFFEYNQIGAYMGEFTPCFFTTLSAEEYISFGILK
jgi:hypothetical protein